MGNCKGDKVRCPERDERVLDWGCASRKAENRIDLRCSIEMETTGLGNGLNVGSGE